MLYSDPREELLHTIVHQLKTPIHAARGCIELVQNLGPLTERQAHFAERAIASMDRMEQLVSRLLDLAWIEGGMKLELTDCDLGAVISSVADSLAGMAAGRQIAIELDLDDSLGLALADVERVTQVVENLVGNAVKYNREGGSVAIKAFGERDYVQVSVRDTGIGIPVDDLDRVFDRFYRSRLGVENGIEGTGLGLAIVQAIIREHGGDIRVESEEGVGTTFTVMLPRKPRLSKGSDSLLETKPKAGKKRSARKPQDSERSSESSDSVDDNLQEAREDAEEDDSRDDDV
jgi:two-component system phosphate regulon sensor histidine kinase PhoR